MSPQKKATVVSTVTAFFLIVIKLTVGLMTGTVVVIASAIDSLLDMVVSIFNFFAIKTAEKPSDEKFNYGRGKIEAIAAVFEGSIITLSGVYIIYEAIKKIMDNRPTEQLDISIAVMVVSLVVTAILVSYLNRIAKKTDNLVIKSDALHYKSDLFSNGGIIISLIIIKFTSISLIDPIVSIGIAIYIMYSAYAIVKEGFMMLMDKALDNDIVENIKSIISNTSDEVTSFHHLKTRQSANIYFVDVHIVFHEKILLRDAHTVSDKIEYQIYKINPDVEWEINIHLDPRDDS